MFFFIYFFTWLGKAKHKGQEKKKKLQKKKEKEGNNNFFSCPTLIAFLNWEKPHTKKMSRLNINTQMVSADKMTPSSTF